MTSNIRLSKDRLFKGKLFKGSIVALVTPMKNDGQIDYDGLRQLIDWHIESGTDALVIMGTTGESASVTKQEHLAIVKSAIEHTNKRIPIIAGCSSPSTQNTLELAEALNELRPDALLCVTPYYIKPMQEGLYQHFSLIAEVSNAPIILYNVPARTACDLENETLIRLASNSNIIGIKDAVADIPRAKQLMGALGSDFCFLSGDDHSAYEYMLAGGTGVISVTGNIAPKQMSRWCQLLLDKELVESKALFESLIPLHDAMFIESNPIPVKWVLNKMAKIDLGIRLPLTQPSVDAQQRIESIMQKCGIL